ncbi:lipid-A-disaccharide synthase [Pseudidiomarina mangrovi]|uniref:lipid-A-disaccharide synthase n=1 Tax=Pseudidiomarina mangrovi TaxID=2487133 RepID=UPI000FCB2021|nr:lipid-A-disaccharide synthase [Pseudidiomarina mangrovi]
MTQHHQAITIALVAGEHSGDLLGAGLIRELKQHFPNAEFVGVGGPLMQAQGFDSLLPMDDLAVMGLAEVLRHLPRLLRHRRSVIKRFIEQPPAVYIGIDAPDFNLPIAKRLKAVGIPTMHYVSPSVWAWRQGRIHGIKQAVDHVLCLLPFEKAFYDQHQLAATFVGHPLADSIQRQSDRDAARQQLQLTVNHEQRLIALLPGSRSGELQRLAPLFLQAASRLAERHADWRFIAPMISPARAQQFQQLQQRYAPNLAIQVVSGQARTVMAAADVLLLTSGTVTLEAMLIKRPMVVAYRFSWLSYVIIKRLFKAAFFSLPNLLAGRRLVPELVQAEVTVERLVTEIELLLNQSNQPLLDQFDQLHALLQQDADRLSAEVAKSLIQDARQ